MLITNDQVDELVSVLADLSGLDAELVARCGGLIRAQRYDEAVSRAFVVLEARMRELMGMGGGTGRQLVNRLFSQNGSQYVDRLNLPEQECQGIRSIFDGAFAAYRNRAAHTVAGYRLDEARAIVNLVNLLLLVVDQMHHAPDQQVQPEVAAALDPAAAERLQRFLTNVQDIGLMRVQGSSQDVYKGTLNYRAPSWEEAKPYAIPVFYLRTGEDPSLRFRMDRLSRVRDLDAKTLESKLLAAGCRRVARKTTPIELVLTQRNDQITFDRIYDILKDLIENHGR
jgi:uncharacterized protein (TIGR02391 family)